VIGLLCASSISEYTTPTTATVTAVPSSAIGEITITWNDQFGKPQQKQLNCGPSRYGISSSCSDEYHVGQTMPVWMNSYGDDASPNSPNSMIIATIVCFVIALALVVVDVTMGFRRRAAARTPVYLPPPVGD